jgi:hypothetical protein
MNNMKGIALGLSLLVGGPTCGWCADAAVKNAPPEWVNQGSGSKNGIFFGVGIGMTRVDALALALGELAAIQNSLVQNPKSTGSTLKSSITSEAKFGKVAANKSFSSTQNGDGNEQVVSQAVTVELKNAGRSFSITVHQRSSTAGSPAKDDEDGSIAIKSVNLGFKDLIDELERAGVRMQVYADDEYTYVRVDYSLKKP